MSFLDNGSFLDRGLSLAVNTVSKSINDGISSPIKSFGDIASGLPDSVTGTLSDSPFGGLLGSVASGLGSNFSKHTLLGLHSRSDPLLSFMWFCLPPTINGVSLPWYYVEEFTAPFRSFDVTTQYREGKVFHFAGQHSISSLSMRLYDDSTGKAGAWLEAWRRSILSKEGYYNLPGGTRGYKKDITVVMLDVTKFGWVYTFNYKGCWPTTADPITLQSGSSDRIISSQEFSCDEVEVIVKNFPPFSLIGILKEGIGSFQGAGLDIFKDVNIGSVQDAANAGVNILSKANLGEHGITDAFNDVRSRFSEAFPGRIDANVLSTSHSGEPSISREFINRDTDVV